MSSTLVHNGADRVRIEVEINGLFPAAADGHQHAVRPPTPAELERAGHEALSRIQREATTP